MQTQEYSQIVTNAMEQYHIHWNSQSKDAGESMPLGGRDIGCNVWVEDNVLFFYMAQSGAFDEKGNMIKAGRCAVAIEPNPFRDSFSQELRLMTGDIRIVGKSDGVETEILLWVDVFEGMIHVEIRSDVEHEVVCSYQNWRQEEFSYRYHDEVRSLGNRILFYTITSVQRFSRIASGRKGWKPLRTCSRMYKKIGFPVECWQQKVCNTQAAGQIPMQGFPADPIVCPEK